MFNVLLDNNFPTDYRGYELNTDFRVGIKLTLLQEDEEFDEQLRLIKAFDLLYKNEVPELNMAVDGLIWFLSCGRSEYHFDSKDEDKCMDKAIDFRVDSLDIWGAFWSKGVDLTKVNMHWFKFMTALSYVGDCPLTQKISYRTVDLSKMKGDTRKYYYELKEKYKVHKLLTNEEYEALEKYREENYGSYWTKLKRGM